MISASCAARVVNATFRTLPLSGSCRFRLQSDNRDIGGRPHLGIVIVLGQGRGNDLSRMPNNSADPKPVSSRGFSYGLLGRRRRRSRGHYRPVRPRKRRPRSWWRTRNQRTGRLPLLADGIAIWTLSCSALGVRRAISPEAAMGDGAVGSIQARQAWMLRVDRRPIRPSTIPSWSLANSTGTTRRAERSQAVRAADRGGAGYGEASPQRSSEQRALYYRRGAVRMTRYSPVVPPGLCICSYGE